jgi:hypothetical protein
MIAVDEWEEEGRLGLLEAVREMLGVDSPSVNLLEEYIMTTHRYQRRRSIIGHLATAAVLRGESAAAAAILSNTGPVTAVGSLVRVLWQAMLLAVSNDHSIPAINRSQTLPWLISATILSPDRAEIERGSKIAIELVDAWCAGTGRQNLSLLSDVCDVSSALPLMSRQAAAAVGVQYLADALQLVFPERDVLALADEQSALAVAMASFDTMRWEAGRVSGTDDC